MLNGPAGHFAHRNTPTQTHSRLYPSHKQDRQNRHAAYAPIHITGSFGMCALCLCIVCLYAMCNVTPCAKHRYLFRMLRGVTCAHKCVYNNGANQRTTLLSGCVLSDTFSKSLEYAVEHILNENGLCSVCVYIFTYFLPEQHHPSSSRRNSAGHKLLSRRQEGFSYGESTSLFYARPATRLQCRMSKRRLKQLRSMRSSLYTQGPEMFISRILEK